jgi:hypothetical protein
MSRLVLRLLLRSNCTFYRRKLTKVEQNIHNLTLFGRGI